MTTLNLLHTAKQALAHMDNEVDRVNSLAFSKAAEELCIAVAAAEAHQTSEAANVRAGRIFRAAFDASKAENAAFLNAMSEMVEQTSTEEPTFDQVVEMAQKALVAAGLWVMPAHEHHLGGLFNGQ